MVVVAYTIAGALASAGVGAVLGELGGVVHVGLIEGEAALAVAVLAVIAAAREIGNVSSSFPQPHRQTREAWGKRHPRPVAAILWGFDLGLVFTTWFTFSGTWVILALAFATASPSLGAMLLVTYWLGRASSVWVAPVLLPEANAMLTVIDRINGARRRFQVAHAMAMMWLAVLLTLSVGTSIW